MEQQLLPRNWNRSYKEDTDLRMVFRNDDFQFPPPTDRFGRASIKLDQDNSFSQRGNIFKKEANQSSNDSFTNIKGKWNFQDGVLMLYPDGGGDGYKLKIVSLDDEQLVIERQNL